MNFRNSLKLRLFHALPFTIYNNFKCVFVRLKPQSTVFPSVYCCCCLPNNSYYENSKYMA